jgi:integrase/recombinase XerD
MKKIFLKKVVHRDLPRLALIFDYNKDLISYVKSIPGARYSGSQNFWYTDDNEENLRTILKAFKDKALIDISALAQSPGINAQEIRDIKTLKREIREKIPEKNDPPPVVKISVDPPDKTDSVRNFGVTLKKIKPVYSPVEFRINDPQGRLSIKFTGYYDKEWISEIKTYGKCYYDKIHREFLLPWSKLTVDSLSDYFSERNVEVRVIKPQPSEKNKESRKNFGDEIRSRELSMESYRGLEYLRKHLEENRYSVRTVESYMALLELFFKFFNKKDPSEIQQNEVSEFMTDFIIKNGFSGSYQNQMISAIKMYYEITGTGKIIPFILERPRRGRALPKVFSKEEIIRILNSTKNNKHKVLLWIIYSCGLRRSEVTNIKMTDIDRERNILHIREGKGGVDRIVPVSGKVWQKIDEYIEGYRPRQYLFEGQAGGRYSSESVYNVFKQALITAGIKKEVGVHSLRHSYATHLHENGVDIRYIQELLGHKSTRTTEIYTHVSRRNLVQVRSPIEDLNLK